jgi:hypothetical protein
MNSEALFVKTLEDLQRRTTDETDEYEVLLSAGLLRKLLMDSTPLINRVNSVEGRRLTIRFRINGPTPYQELLLSHGPIFWSLEDGIDPDLGQPPGLVNPVEATRDQLLARQVMQLQGTPVTVRDLIDQLAHIEGAVHNQQPRERREELLKAVAQQIYIRGLPAGVSQIRSIGRVVIRGLRPLRDAVEAESI